MSVSAMQSHDAYSDVLDLFLKTTLEGNGGAGLLKWPQKQSPFCGGQKASQGGYPSPPIANRQGLAFAMKRGHDLDNDEDNENSLRPLRLAIGSTKIVPGDFGRNLPRGVKFLSAYDEATDAAHSAFHFNFDRRYIYISIRFSTHTHIPSAMMPLLAEIPFDDIITRGVQCYGEKITSDNTKFVLTVTTRRPPRFYVPVKGSKDELRRATEADFVNARGPMVSTAGRSLAEMKAQGFIIAEGHAGPIMVVPDDLSIRINAWLAYRFTFELNQRQAYTFKQHIRKLKMLGNEDGQDILSHLSNTKQRQLIEPVPIPMLFSPQDHLNQISEFKIRILVEGLISQAIVIPSELPELMAALGRSTPDVNLRERVLCALFNEERVKNVTRLVEARTKQLRRQRTSTDRHMVLVYRCMVTPTRVMLFPAEQETSNDVIRKHARHVDRFLRVQFTDEDSVMQINPRVKVADAVSPHLGTIARVRRALASGLDIAGRHYVFLAAGTSQARQHACWFFADETGPGGLKADKVRENIGLNNIQETIVAKYGARMGLPFSTTRPLAMQANIRNERQDIQKNGFTFTDGVGLCGLNVIKRAALEFGIKGGVESLPSAIQVRCGGAKGVLGFWPKIMREDDVAFRPSMIKYRVSEKDMSYGLNVVRTAHYRCAFLNRQFIILMESLGVSSKFLVNEFEKAIKNVRGLPDRYIKGTTTREDQRLVRSFAQFPAKDLAEHGFNADPLLGDVLRVLEAKLLTDLKWKARLEVENGVYLMGIADEFGLLEEGQVFCQWHDPTSGDPPKIVEGPCVIMRAPSLHQGDIRMVTAVNRPQLRHLKNVIVFNVRGYRDLPNMLSGGDLDDYTLIWDENYWPKRQVPSMDYTPPEPRRVDRVTLDNVKEFFVDYILNDILGQVSNAWLAQADRNGPDSDFCLQLANAASIAVDFPKTGVAAEMRIEQRPRRWPSFMGKDAHLSYTSNKILGQLFDLVHPEPVFAPTDIRLLGRAQVSALWLWDCSRCSVDARLAMFKVPTTVLAEALLIKEDYDVDITGLMQRFKVTEAEILAGIVLKNKKRRRYRDGDLKDPVNDAFKEICTTTIEAAQNIMAKRRLKSVLSPMQIFAVAAYQVTYDPKIRAESEAERRKWQYGEDNTVDVAPEEIYMDSPRLSFAWLLWRELLSLPNITNAT